MGNIIIHTYHSCFVPEGAVKSSQIFLPDANDLRRLLSYEEYYIYVYVTGGKPLAV
jgi:hypothetical protein